MPLGFTIAAIVRGIVLSFLAYILLGIPICFLRNLRKAKASGLRYRMLPWHIYNFKTARFMRGTVLPFVNRYLDEPSITSWRRLVVPTWPMKLKHAPFAALGTDTFMAVSPGGNIFYTSDADVISQVMARSSDFPKATELYKMISIFGINVVSAEGAVWRRHRKLTSVAFSERNNQLVWSATLDRAQVMINQWTNAGAQSYTIQEMKKVTEKLSLEVLGRALLGQEMDWIEDSQCFADGHTMSFTYSLQYICHHLLVILMLLQTLPTWFLKIAPSENIRKSYEAFDNWRRYMREMISRRKIELRSLDHKSSHVDIISQLIKGQDETHLYPESVSLSDEEVLGNLFVFIQAGHETSASSIHFCILLLALHPSVLREVQFELDEIFRGRNVADWDYEKSLPRLLNGKLGAVMNEQLRVISPVLTIPKVVTNTPQHLLVDGKQVTLPANTTMRLCSPAVHVNPNFWPHGSPKDPHNPISPQGNIRNDLEEFKPSRWYQSQCQTSPTQSIPPYPIKPLNYNARSRHSTQKSTSSSASSSTNSSPERQPSLFTPYKGSYLPFSDGQRVCLGRRFAQIEVLAALAAIFSQYSVELEIPGVSDEQISKMSKAERKDVWQKAEKKGQKEWRDNITCVIIAQLTAKAKIPLRFVKRGEERFGDLDI